jgi:hypothetical protein
MGSGLTMVQTQRQVDNRILEAPVVFLAVVMAYLPAEIAFRSLVPSYGTLLVIIAAGIVLIAGLFDSLAHKVEYLNKRPSLRVLLAATAAYTAYTALASSGLLLIYGIAYGVIKLISVIASAHWNGATVAAICAVVLSSVLAILWASAGWEDISRGLYRKLPSEPAPFEEFAPNWHSQGVVFFIVEAVVSTLLVLIWPLIPDAAAWYGTGGLAVLLITALAGLGSVNWPEETAQAVVSVRDRIEAALQSLGYEVTPRPRVDDVVTDSLLDFVDIVAQQESRVFALRISQAKPERQEIIWNSVADMIVAANSLQQYIAGSQAARVEPVIVLVDAKPDKTLSQLAETEQLRLIKISAEDETSSISETFKAGLAERKGTSADAHEEATADSYMNQQGTQNGPQITRRLA